MFAVTGNRFENRSGFGCLPLVENEIEELYDIENDPEELTNLALDRRYRNQLQSMRAGMIAEMRRTDWELVDQLPSLCEPSN